MQSGIIKKPTDKLNCNSENIQKSKRGQKQRKLKAK